MRSLNLGTAAIALSNVVLVIFFVVEGINDGVVKGKKTRHLPSPFRKTFRLNENRTKLVCFMSSVRKVG